MYVPGSPHFFYFEKDPPRHTKKSEAFLGRKVTEQNSQALPHASIILRRLQKTLILTELLAYKPSQVSV